MRRIMEKEENIHTRGPVITRWLQHQRQVKQYQTPGEISRESGKNGVGESEKRKQCKKNINQDPSQTKYNKGYREAAPD